MKGIGKMGRCREGESTYGRTGLSTKETTRIAKNKGSESLRSPDQKISTRASGRMESRMAWGY